MRQRRRRSGDARLRMRSSAIASSQQGSEVVCFRGIGRERGLVEGGTFEDYARIAREWVDLSPCPHGISDCDGERHNELAERQEVGDVDRAKYLSPDGFRPIGQGEESRQKDRERPAEDWPHE